MYEVFGCTCMKCQLMFIQVSLTHLVVIGYHSIATETLNLFNVTNSSVFMNVCAPLQPQRQ